MNDFKKSLEEPVEFSCRKKNNRQKLQGCEKMQKRPTWATVVGILGIIISSLGILGAGQIIILPKMAEFQKEMFSAMTKQMERDFAEKDTTSKGEHERTNSTPPKEMFEFIQKIWNFPEWFKTWSLIFGLLQLIIGGFYLFSSIWLLQVKPISIKMFYFSAGAAILLGIISSVVAVMSSSFIIIMMMFWSTLGIVIHIVLLLVVATGNKEAFLPITPDVL
jgi:hypothetical protein